MGLDMQIFRSAKIDGLGRDGYMDLFYNEDAKDDKNAFPEVAYWRKEYDLDSWFWDRMDESKDYDCNATVTRAMLEELLASLDTIELRDREATRATIEKILEETDFDTHILVYWTC